MEVLIIPGLLGHPDEVTFQQLGEKLKAAGHTVTKIAWPYFPTDLNKYSFTETLAYLRDLLPTKNESEFALLGSSMGGIIATILASEFKPKKLVLLVSPYQAGTDDDLAGKYSEWQETGFRKMISSVYGELEIPFSFIEDARKYNALDFIQKVHCPTLFIVGENDDKVPLEATKKLFEKANGPKEWHQIEEMVHKYQYQDGMLEKVNKVIIDFIKK